MQAGFEALDGLFCVASAALALRRPSEINRRYFGRLSIGEVSKSQVGEVV